MTTAATTAIGAAAAAAMDPATMDARRIIELADEAAARAKGLDGSRVGWVRRLEAKHRATLAEMQRLGASPLGDGGRPDGLDLAELAVIAIRGRLDLVEGRPLRLRAARLASDGLAGGDAPATLERYLSARAPDAGNLAGGRVAVAAAAAPPPADPFAADWTARRAAAARPRLPGWEASVAAYGKSAAAALLSAAGGGDAGACGALGLGLRDAGLADLAAPLLALAGAAGGRAGLLLDMQLHPEDAKET